MKQEDLLQALLPEDLLEYFDLTGIDQQPESTFIHLEERNIAPEQSTDDKLVSKGFYDPVTVQDFPLRGKACYLKVKRRRWLNESTGMIAIRDWDLVAKGTRMTKQFASFLKAINR